MHMFYAGPLGTMLNPIEAWATVCLLTEQSLLNT